MLAICIICLWISMILIFVVNIFIAFKNHKTHQQKMHQIPYYKCDFLTNDYRLKCTVKPVEACTKNAINCFDFEPKTKIININHRPWWKLWKFF